MMGISHCTPVVSFVFPEKRKQEFCLVPRIVREQELLVLATSNVSIKMNYRDACSRHGEWNKVDEHLLHLTQLSVQCRSAELRLYMACILFSLKIYEIVCFSFFKGFIT